MRNILQLTLAGALLVAVYSMPTAAMAQDRIDHFKGEPAATIEQALQNIAEYNQRLSTVLASELTPTKMAEIHQLTYTLENALERLREDLAELADTLEEVHVASETMDYTVVKKAGELYLQTSQQLIIKPRE